MNRCFRKTNLFAFFCLILFMNLSGCTNRTVPALEPFIPDLVIFTCQEEPVYEPIIKEYQERTGLSVQILSGTYQELQDRILSETLADDCDVVFGISSGSLERTPDTWEPYTSSLSQSVYAVFNSADGTWTGFSAIPLVIMYNTRVVTYRELPAGWNSLLEPRWRGRIAFMDPELSDAYSSPLAAAVYTSAEPSKYPERLAENLDYTTFDTLSAVNQAIAEGRCFVGVTLEEKAESLRREGADIDYIYPEEGTCVLIDGSAVVAGCKNPEQAKAFIDYTISVDVQHFLTSNINRRSVRTDALPPEGLNQLSQLSILPADSETLSDLYQNTLKEWRKAVNQ